MLNDINKARELLNKYQRGQCTEAEKAILQQWYDRLNLGSASDHPVDAKALEQRLEAAILNRINKNAVKKPAAVLVQLLRHRAAAAAIIFLMAAAGGYLFLSHNKEKTAIATLTHRVFNDASSPKKLDLPDGTTVWLNARSTLSWTNEFGREYRKVVLDGEGYFEVQKDPAHPFLVTAKDVTTRVTGTAFNVEAYSWEHQVRVALVHGSVELSGEKENMPHGALQPGQVGSLAAGGDHFEIRQEDVSGYYSWITGSPYFKEAPLSEVVERICHRYGYVLQGSLPNGQGSKPITIRFDAGQNAEDMISGLLYISHIDFSIQHKTIIIK